MSDDILPLRLVHKSVERQILLAGGERAPLLFSILIGATEGFAVTVSFGPWWGVPFGALVIAGLVYVVKKMGGADPRMTKVAVRHLKYRRYFPARAHVAAEIPDVKTFR